MPKCELIVKGRFEWFSEKEKINIQKHNLSFDEVLSIFDDECFFEIYDGKHSSADQFRFIGLGITKSSWLCVLQVVYTEAKRIHIISARQATNNERRFYYEQIRQNF